MNKTTSARALLGQVLRHGRTRFAPDFTRRTDETDPILDGAALAERIGIEPAAIAALENGETKITEDQLAATARALGLTTRALLLLCLAPVSEAEEQAVPPPPLRGRVLSDVVRNVRQKAGLSEKDFGKKIGAAQSTVNRWSSGVVAIGDEEIDQIAEGLRRDAKSVLLDGLLREQENDSRREEIAQSFSALVRARYRQAFEMGRVTHAAVADEIGVHRSSVLRFFEGGGLSAEGAVKLVALLDRVAPLAPYAIMKERAA